MKKLDFSYLFTWITTLLLVSVLYYWCINPVRTVGAFFIETIKYRYIFAYAVGTVIICAALGVNMFRLGKRSGSISIWVILLNQALGACIYTGIFALTGGSGIVNPCVILYTQYEKLWTTNDIVVENPLGELIILCILQTLIYIFVSLIGCFIGKKAEKKHSTKKGDI